MNGEGQRPPAPPDTGQATAADAPEPGNARYPQPGMNGNGTGQYGQGQGQEGQGGGRRRFRRNRRGGRGRRGKGHGQNQVAAPLDAQGRIVDVENDGAEDGSAEETGVEVIAAPQPQSAPSEPQPGGETPLP